MCLLKFKEILTTIERDEIKSIPTVYYLGKRRPKLNAVMFSFDDEHGDMKVYARDHMSYRFEVIEILGKGSFGQVFKVYDHKAKEHLALKIIKNRSKYTNQAMI